MEEEHPRRRMGCKKLICRLIAVNTASHTARRNKRRHRVRDHQENDLERVEEEPKAEAHHHQRGHRPDGATRAALRCVT